MLVLVISIGFLVPKAMAQSDKYSKMAPLEAVLLDFQVARHNGVTRQEQPPKLVAVSN
jgi:hypothetical protein